MASSYNQKMDYYEILGLDRNATKDDIKSAYRKLSLKYHPDTNDAANATAFFRLIQEAYETLSDPVERTIYDSSLKFENSPFSNSQQDTSSDWGEPAGWEFYQQTKKRLPAVVRFPLKLLCLLILPFVALSCLFLEFITAWAFMISRFFLGLFLFLSLFDIQGSIQDFKENPFILVGLLFIFGFPYFIGYVSAFLLIAKDKLYDIVHM
ncbi:MAG: J domain-containing protein [Eubacteriales bacterium]|nr:J domain-containing protein [Eubacteriales bacterium]